jgi:hypothetical protein
MYVCTYSSTLPHICLFITLLALYLIDQLRAVAAVRALMKVRGHTLTPGDIDAVQEQLIALVASTQSDVQGSADDSVIGSGIILSGVPLSN